jgi:hypothetical protein
MKFRLYDDELRIQFEALARDPADSWLRLRYAISDYWTIGPASNTKSTTKSTLPHRSRGSAG